MNPEKAFVHGNEFIVNLEKAFVYGYWKGLETYVYGKALVFEFSTGHYSLAFLFGFFRVLKEFREPKKLMKMLRTRNKRSTMALLTQIMNIQHIKK